MVMPLNGPLSLDAPKKPKIQGSLGTKPPKNKKQKGGYTVQAGDNYFTIAEKLFGNQRYAGLLISANGGMLRPGDVITVPDVEGGDPNVYFSPGAYRRAQELTAQTAYGQRQTQAAQAQTAQTQVTLTNPPTISSVGTNNYSNLAAQTPPTPYAPPTTGVGMPPGYVNYSALAAQGTPRPQSSPSYPIAGQVVPPYAGWYGATQQKKQMTKTGGRKTGRPGDVPVFPGTGAGQPPLAPRPPSVAGQGLIPGTGIPTTPQASGYYTGIGNQPYPIPPYGLSAPDYGNIQGATPYTPRPQYEHPIYGQQLPQRGMTGAQTALALESGIANKPAGTYQVNRGVYTPIYDANGNIVGYNTLPTGETINVGVMGTKPAAYVGFTGDALNGGKPGQGRIIGGGEGYADYTPAGIPRPPGTPVYPGGQMGGGGGGGGGRRGGGGGGGGPTGGGGRGAPARYTPPAVFAQANSLPGGYRNPARDVAGLSRTGLVTWRL